jgi:hypothetical protein
MTVLQYSEKETGNANNQLTRADQQDDKVVFFFLREDGKQKHVLGKLLHQRRFTHRHRSQLTTAADHPSSHSLLTLAPEF